MFGNHIGNHVLVVNVCLGPTKRHELLIATVMNQIYRSVLKSIDTLAQKTRRRYTRSGATRYLVRSDGVQFYWHRSIKDPSDARVLRVAKH